MSSNRHATVRAALVDAGIPIDQADKFAADIDRELDQEAGGPSWFSDALANRNKRSTRRLFTNDQPTDAA